MQHYSWRCKPVNIHSCCASQTKKRKRMRKGYWKAYDRATKNNLKKIYDFCLGVCVELGSPWKLCGRGRPPKILPVEHAALHMLRRLIGKASRFIERFFPLLSNKDIDHSWVCKTLQRIPFEYLDRAIALVDQKIVGFVKRVKTVFITDSTGISTDRKRTVLIKDKEVKKTIVDKQHIIARYIRAKSIVSIVRSKPTHEHRNDSPVLKEQLDFQGNGEDFFGDMGYDAKANRQHLKKHCFNPIIKYRQYEKTKHEKPKQLTPQETKKYKSNRGRIETTFGGAENEYNNKTCYRKTSQRHKDSKLLSLAHNIKTYFRTKSQAITTKITYLIDTLTARETYL